MFKFKFLIQMIFSCLTATLATALIVSAATTIGSNITTDGTLGVTGLTTLVNASSTQLTATGSAYLATTGGRVGIGTANPMAKIHVGNGITNNSDDSQVLISRTVDDSVVGNGHAFSDSSVVTRGGAIGYNSFDARIDYSGTNDFDHYAGFQSLPTYSSSGTMANYYGLYAGLTADSGTVANFYGAYVANPAGAGSVTNSYGVYVANLTKGGALNYAVYTAGTATSSFGGAVGIGTADPGYKLDVNGIVSAAPAGIGGFYFGPRGRITQDTSYNWLFSTNGVANALAIQSSTGNFGIGTTSPAVKLQITPGSNAEPMTPGTASGGFALTSSTGLFGLYAGVRSSGSAWLQSGRIDGSQSVYNILFQPNGGNVGIGTSTPVATLDIEGFMRLKKNTAQPAACSTANAGALAMNSSYVGCVCNGFSWAYFASSTQACVW